MAEQPREPIHAAPLLVGRERELAILREALGAALAGRGALVLIGGDAGIGKTALAEWTLAEATGRGALALVGRCYDLAETPPHGPWAEALARAPRDPPLPAPPDLGGGAGLASQAALFARVRAYLAALAARRPVVLLLDDLHWADPASLDLLRVVARGLADLPALVLACHRADEVMPGHPLYARLPLLLREAPATPLALRPLGEEDTRALVAARYWLAAADARRLVGHLHAHAQGNPFYTRELLRSLEEALLLHPGEAGWQLGDLTGVAVPGLLRQVVGARVARLGADATRLLALAAVVGQEVPLDLWAAVAGVGEEALLAVVERALDARVLAAEDGGARVAFAHALVREALYAGLSPVRRRGAHRHVAEALLATPRPDPDAVADQLARAGDPRAAAWLIRAGERAGRAFAWDTAAARLVAALALLEEGGAAPGERGWVLARLGYLQRHTDPARALATLDEAERAAVAADDDALAVGARFARGFLRCLRGDLRRGLAELRAAVAALADLPAADRARLRALDTDDTTFDADGLRAIYLGWLAGIGPYGEVAALGERLVARPAAAPGARPAGRAVDASAHRALGRAYAALGRPDAAGRAFAAAHAAWSAGGDHFNAALTAVLALTWVALPYAGDQPAERRRAADLAEEGFARATGSLAGGGPFLRAARLPLLALDGRWDEALARAADVRASGPLFVLAAAPALGALAHARGLAGAARAQVRTCLAVGPATPPGDGPSLEAMALQRLAAGLALDAGDPAEACAWLAAHDRWLAWSGAVLGRAEGQLGWAAYHRAAGALAQARAHAEQALAHATGPRQPLALLAAHRALGELAADAGHHVDAATHLDVALALAEACEAPYERALTVLALAELRAAGDRDAAHAALAEARATLADLGAAPALARAGTLAVALAAPAAAPSRPDGLTAREVEVLRLYAADLSYRAIAARLAIAPRTVGTHMSNIYGKTGIASRLAAAHYAAAHGLA